MQHISDNLKRIAKVRPITKKNTFKHRPMNNVEEIKTVLGDELDTDLLDFMLDDTLLDDWY